MAFRPVERFLDSNAGFRPPGHQRSIQLLRIKGGLFHLEGSAAAIEKAEDHYLQALEWPRQQKALSSEL